MNRPASVLASVAMLLTCLSLDDPTLARDATAPTLAAGSVTRSGDVRSREKSERRFSVWAGPRGAARFGNGGAGGGGSGAIGAGVRVFRGLWIAAEVAEGFYTDPNETVGQIRMGLRYEPWTRPVRPFVFVGADHAHQQSWARTQDQPFLTLFGASDDIEHRTGVAAGVGVRVPLSQRERGFLRYFSVVPRLDFSYFVDTKKSPAVLGAAILIAAWF